MTEEQMPDITGLVPVLAIDSYQQAVGFYVDGLGFQLDWEWRRAPAEPVILAISRGAASLMLNEAGLGTGPAWLTLSVADLDALAAEWNERRAMTGRQEEAERIEVVIGPPYDIPTVSITDPFGNHLDFQQPVGAEEEHRRTLRGAAMREFIDAELAAGRSYPSAETLVASIGPPVGLALDVLCKHQQQST